MMKLRFRHVLLAACVIALSITYLASLHAAKPGTGGTTTPPVRYKLNYLAPPVGASNFNAVWAMNESGAMVGDCFTAGLPDSWSGFNYDPPPNPHQAFNPDGWWIRYAYCRRNGCERILDAIRRAANIFPPAVSGFFAISRTVNYWAMSPSERP